MRYNKPVYSDEQIKKWADASVRHSNYMKAHTNETVKDFEVAGYIIRCIQRKYDACMNKENEYGIQVWTEDPNTVKIENVADACVSNDWFNNCNEANARFKEVKAMCY